MFWFSKDLKIITILNKIKKQIKITKTTILIEMKRRKDIEIEIKKRICKNKRRLNQHQDQNIAKKFKYHNKWNRKDQNMFKKVIL